MTKSGVESLCVLSRRTASGTAGGMGGSTGDGGGGGSVCDDLEKVDLSQCRNFSGGGRKWWATVSRNGKIKFVL